MKLRTRFALAATSLVAVVLAGVSASLFWVEYTHLTKQWEDIKLDAIQKLSSVCREGYLSQNDVVIINYVKTLSQNQEIAYAIFLNPSGNILIHNEMGHAGSRLQDPISLKALDSKTILIQNYLHPQRGNISEVSQPVIYGNQNIGLCRIGYYQEKIEKTVKITLKETLKRLAAVSVGAMFLGIIGSFVMARTMTQPIRILELGAHMIGEGKLDHRIPVLRHDELGELAKQFNEMAKALAKLDQMKNDFVASVSHELRSPLTAIKSYVDMVIRGKTGDISPKTREYLDVVISSTNRLANFINDILDLAKIEAGMTHIIPEPAKMPKVMEDIATLFRLTAEQNKCSIAVNAPDNLPLINADPDKIRQVLTNLVSNALKFTPEGGRVVLSATHSGNGFVECAVSDTGVGIPNEYLSKIFNKFEQANNQKQARNVKGTGLGLAIVKGIVEAHGGRIWVESKVGVGSAFKFTIPLVKG